MTAIRRIGGALVALACTASGVLRSEPAHAQTAAAVYDDVKDVFVQLVELRASEDATAFVERASLGLAHYLSRSLEHVRRSQWGALQSSLRDDFADLSADYVLWAMRHAEDPALSARTDRGALFRSFLDCFEPPDLQNRATQLACAPLRALAQNAERFGHSTLRDQECEVMRPRRQNGDELTCEVSQLVHSAFLGHVDAAHLYSVQVLSAIGSFLPPSSSGSPGRVRNGPRNHEPLRALLRDVLNRPTDGSNSPESWRLDAPPDRALHEALADCPSGSSRSLESLVRALLDSRAGAGSDSASTAAVCLDARVSIPVSVTVRRAGADTDAGDAIRDLARAPAAARTDQALLDAVEKNGAADRVELLGLACSPSGGCTAGGQRTELTLSDALKAAVALDELEGRIFPASPTGETFRCSGHCPFETVSLAADFAALRDEQAPPNEVRALSDVADEFVHGLGIVTVRLRDRCAGSARSEDCAPRRDRLPIVLRLARALSPAPEGQWEGSGMGQTVRDALEGRRAEIASGALRAAFDELFETGAAGRLDRLFADLIVNVTQFELGDPSADGRTVAHDALRASAIRLVDGLASETGYRSTGITLRPIVSLRASWNQGYHNERGVNGLRYVASVDWPAVRTRLSDVAVLQFSLFDLLAPLDEIAAREVPSESVNFQYDAQGFLVLDAIRPRINLLLGYPSLSRNLVVSAGAAFRTVTQRQVVESTSSGLQTFRRYRTTFGAKQDLADALELNVGVSYVF